MGSIHRLGIYVLALILLAVGLFLSFDSAVVWLWHFTLRQPEAQQIIPKEAFLLGALAVACLYYSFDITTIPREIFKRRPFRLSAIIFGIIIYLCVVALIYANTPHH